MRSRLLLLMLVGLSIHVPAGVVKSIHVERRDIGESLGKFVLPVDIKGKGYISKEVWRSPKGIKCTASLFEHSKKNKGTFECVSPEQYKAQVALDCSENHSAETAVYLFFGKVSSDSEVGNLYVWCE
ncbi:hypothetical protein [Motiliproteus sediminis]|uniref:hypothetical protein n=1 Tax=Motiliproteus sediminis TaxID=1468178 RepID=UPI001AF01A89|nr:hypothetical protein [Motiliproteus sediminis]